MPLSIQQEGLLNELIRQFNTLKHLDTTGFQEDMTQHPQVQQVLKQLLPIWGYVDFADIVTAGVVQHGKQWVCERPLENLIHAITSIPLSHTQKTTLFLDALINTHKSVPEAQRQVILDLIGNNT